MKTFLKAAGLIVATTVGLAASAAQAQIVHGVGATNVKTIIITNARVQQNPPTADDLNQSYIQIGDVSARDVVTYKNVSHAINGATAINGGTGTIYASYGTTTAAAIDEVLSADYANPASIYHSGNNPADFLRIDLASLTTLRNLSIIGRSGGWDSRDYYNYSFLDGSGNQVASGTLDNRGLDGAAHLVSFVPEPAVWAMMILGMGVVGGAMRRRKAIATPAFA